MQRRARTSAILLLVGAVGAAGGACDPGGQTAATQTPPPSGTFPLIPAERLTVWNPGIPGGV